MLSIMEKIKEEQVIKLTKEHYCKNYIGIVPSLSLYLKGLSVDSEKEHMDKVWQYVPRHENMNVLDAGCGFGSLMLYLKSLNLQTIGIDSDEDSLNIARLRGCEVVKSYCELLPFNDESFDLVTSCSTIEHVGSASQCLRECLRVVKTGGFVYVNAPNYDSDWEGHYKVRFGLPLLPHFLRWFLLWVKGRKAGFYLTLNHVTTRGVKRFLKSEGHTVIDLLEVDLRKRVENPVGTRDFLFSLCFKLGFGRIVLYVQSIYAGHMVLLAKKEVKS